MGDLHWGQSRSESQKETPRENSGPNHLQDVQRTLPFQQSFSNRAIAKRLSGISRQPTAVIQRKIKLGRDGQEIVPDSQSDVLSWIAEYDAERNTRYGEEVAGLEEYLSALVSSGVDVSELVGAYSFPGLLVQNLREIESVRKLDRWLLLRDIRKKMFEGRPNTLLYLGSGGDVKNPLITTGARHLTLVDHIEPVDPKTGKLVDLDAEAQEIAFKEADSGSVEDRFVTVAPLVDFHLSDAMGFLREIDAVDRFDVLFDKDSWLGEIKDPDFLPMYLRALKPGGVWITNHPNEAVANSLQVLGFNNITSRLLPELMHVSFGNSTVTVLRKTRSLSLEELMPATFFKELFKGFTLFDPVINLELYYNFRHPDDVENTLEYYKMQFQRVLKGAYPEFQRSLEEKVRVRLEDIAQQVIAKFGSAEEEL
jgi:hypothetical protein